MARVPTGQPYTPKRGALAGQTFAGQMDYMNARSRLKGFANYTEERNFRLDEAVRAAVLNLYPEYPEIRMERVLAKSNRIKTKLRYVKSREDLAVEDLGEESDVWYH